MTLDAIPAEHAFTRIHEHQLEDLPYFSLAMLDWREVSGMFRQLAIDCAWLYCTLNVLPHAFEE